MNIEKQVCTIEQSKRLSEFGITAKALFYWREYLDESVSEWQTALLLNDKTDDNCIKYALADSSYPAFTVAELGVMIPEWHFTYSRLEGYASYKNEDGEFSVADGTVNGQNYDTEAECRAALVIYLIENNTLSIQTCNSRLLQ